VAPARLVLVTPEHLEQGVPAQRAFREGQHGEQRELAALCGKLCLLAPIGAKEGQTPEGDEPEAVVSQLVEKLRLGTRSADEVGVRGKTDLPPCFESKIGPGGPKREGLSGLQA
jgi:hypothetical protein